MHYLKNITNESVSQSVNLYEPHVTYMGYIIFRRIFGPVITMLLYFVINESRLGKFGYKEIYLGAPLRKVFLREGTVR